MGKQFTEISESHQRFIEAQKMFFVGTAGAEGKVNLSPKGLDSLRVLDSQRVIWLNVTGSGNETAAHVLENGRMTLMFCAFEGGPQILRLYGTAHALHPRDAEWPELIALLPDQPGARQIFELKVDMVQSSCGMAVPLYEYQGQRDALTKWAEKRENGQLEAYWEEKNQQSLDGKPTGI